MGPYATLFILLALLAGLIVGKAWERYKLKDGRWIDRRRARESPHYMLGLNFLVANQIDQAIEELSAAAEAAGDPLEIHLILGNLYREKGQVGRAIQEHQSLLQRANLRTLEHANVLLCLGLDYRHGGFVDRAFEAFSEVLRLDPHNRYALSNLEKLHEEQHQWTDAYAMRQQQAARDTPDQQPRHQQILAFLENEIGLAAMKRHELPEAARRFEAAIALDPQERPRLPESGRCPCSSRATRRGDRRMGTAGRDLAGSGLSGVFTARAAPTPARRRGPLPGALRRLIAANPQDWRARLAMARHLTAPATPQTRSRCSSRRSSSIPTRSRCTRRSGRRCPS